MHISFIRSLLYHSHMEYDLYYLSNESFTLKEISKKSLDIKERSFLREKNTLNCFSDPILNEYINTRKIFNPCNNHPTLRVIAGKEGWDILKWY